MVVEKYQTATFKGAPFFWKQLSADLGKRTVTHDYPGSPRRFVEDMSVLPRTFTIDAEIMGGDEYYANKTRLENALSSPGAGLLVHPTYGRVMVTAKPASVIEEVTSAGLAKYQLTFEKSDEEIRPVGVAASARKIELAKNKALDEVSAAAAEEYTVPESPTAFDAAMKQIDSISNKMQKASGAIAAKRADAFAVFTKIQTFKNNASDLVTQPIGLFNDIKAIFDQVMSMDDFITDQFKRITGFFGARSDLAPGDTGTETKPIINYSYESKATERNRVIISETTNTNAIIHSYDVISKIDFKNVDDLDKAVEKVEKQFTIISDSILMQKPLRDTILELRSAAHQLLDEKRISIKQTVTREFSQETPLAVALFMEQGNIDDEEYVIGLNPQQDIVFAKGNVRLLK